MVARSTRYYRKNKAARKRKYKTDKKINARPEQRKRRTELSKKRKEAKKKGQNIKGKDYDHAKKRFVKSSKNRGRTGEGGRKKGSKRSAAVRKKLGRRYKKR